MVIKKIKKISIYQFGILLLMLISLIIKIVINSGVSGPIIYGDELIYKRRAAELFFSHIYTSPSYPLGYPLVISFGFLFTDNFYLISKVINAILTTSVILFTWKLCRLFLEEKYSLMCALIATLLQWQYMSTPHLISENLYFPLLILVCYHFMKTVKENTLRGRISLGLLLALLHLTRHITVVLLPVFIIVWILDQNNAGKWIINIKKKKIWELCQIFFLYVIVFGIWVILMKIQLGEGYGLLDVLGVGVSAGVGMESIKAYVSVSGLIKMTVLYASYTILSLLFILPTCFLGIWNTILGKFDIFTTKIIMLVFLLTGALEVASIRHSWRVEYNYPQIIHILGRYIWYVGLLWIVLYFIFISGNVKINIKILAGCHIISMVITIASIFVLITDSVFNLGDSFLGDFNTKDIFYLKNIYILIIIAYIIGLFLLVMNKIKYNLWTICILIITLIYGLIRCMCYDDYEYDGIFGNQIEKFNDEYGLENYDYLVTDIPVNNLVWDIEFWTMNDEEPIVFYEDGIEMDMYYDRTYADYKKVELVKVENFDKNKYIDRKGIIFCKVDSNYASKPYIQFEYKDNIYGIYDSPVCLKDTGSLTIEQTYPNNITEGEGFNIQENGNSALGIQTNLPKELLEVYINSEKVQDMPTDENGLGAIILPSKYFENAGILEIQLKLIKKEKFVEDILSNKVMIVISEK